MFNYRLLASITMTTKPNTPIFKLTGFSPIGFKMINYPVQFCFLCRGYLTEVCGTCFENKNENCNVISHDNSYYHVHCYTVMNTDKTKSKSKKTELSDDD